MHPTNGRYITNEAWQSPVGRADAIDEIADQFERLAGAEQFWSSVGNSRSVVSMREWSDRRSMPAADDAHPKVHGDVAHG